jgi:hypothetical protein
MKSHQGVVTDVGFIRPPDRRHGVMPCWCR